MFGGNFRVNSFDFDMISKFGSLVLTLVGWGWAWYKLNKQHEMTKQLQVLAEQQKYMNQRSLTEFSLYTTKKHERSIELYEKLYNARNKVLWRNSPLRQLPTFKDYNKKDMIAFLERFNITKGRKEELLNRWEQNDRDVVKEIYDMMTAQEDLDANVAIHEAVKAHLQADLYLPRDISSIIDRFTSDLNQLAFLCSQETRQHISGERHQEMYEQRTELAKNVEKQFPVIVKNMQKMLLNDGVVSD